jgi:hypothetical protein
MSEVPTELQELDSEPALGKTISPKVGVPAFVLAVYAAIIATLAWLGVAIPPEVVGAWGAVITLGSGWAAPRA